MAKGTQTSIFDDGALVSKLFAKGFLDLPCRVVNRPRWKDEWLVVLDVPVPAGEPQRMFYSDKANVQITSGDPNSEDGALGKVQAPIAVEATKRANQRNELVLIAGLPGDPYTGGQWIGIPMDFITKEYA